MKKRPAKSVSAKERERRAAAVVSQTGVRPRGIRFVSFRNLTAAERTHGKSLAGRAAALLSAKARELATSR
jgi:hypothetical protein